MTAISTILKAQQRRRHARVLTSTLAFILIALIAYLVLLGQGSVELSPRQVIDVLTGGGSESHIRVVWDLRLPVAIATVIVGTALGLAGSWTQTMARNPLASPDILGVTGGASVLVVLGTVHSRPSFAEGIPEFWWRACLATIGALLVVLLLAALGGIGTSNRIVIVGIALSLMFQAIVAYLMRSAQVLRAAEAQTWLAGSTGFVRMEVIFPLLAALAPFLAIGIWLSLIHI